MIRFGVIAELTNHIFDHFEGFEHRRVIVSRLKRSQRRSSQIWMHHFGAKPISSLSGRQIYPSADGLSFVRNDTVAVLSVISIRFLDELGVLKATPSTQQGFFDGGAVF